ncbi:flagellar biosynthesis protein FlhA [Pseudooceanicola sp. C21-150M6]|uniref:flagellar biosynthesis protein FlhA n=1 Tax=Pseudooceanicola sp. C21-150M6 TaxID=3434355 RepID=UPI003D7F27FB
MAVVLMMVLPVPPVVLDLGLAFSFGVATLLLTITLFVNRPLDFSTFPTVLLAAVMLRLSLNVSSTKLIIQDGHTGTLAAGHVIDGFANFVMGGNVFLGLVIFLVLLIVNFMVITKGASRMAEVGARFALDGMPGKQLAIDSDMSAGAIDHAEAKSRRELEQKETTFFGSLDGVSKFVKGDAIAGLLITSLNFLVGLFMGVFVHGMPVSRAFETYTILTVGDGLVTQVPAVIISIASALLLARGGNTGAADAAISAQVRNYPEALFTVAFVMALMSVVPGLPVAPFLAASLVLAIVAFYCLRLKVIQKNASSVETIEEVQVVRPLGDVLDLDDIHLEFSPDLVDMVLDPGTGLDARISNIRSYVATKFGLVLPDIRLTDDPSLPSGNYVVKMLGVVLARDVLLHDHVMVLLSGKDDDVPAGEDVAEPVYGAAARWIHEEDKDAAALSGVTLVSPNEILATHLLELIKQNLSRLLSAKSLRRLLDEMVNLSDPIRAEANRRLLDEMIPDRVPKDCLHQVLRLLLDEQVSIRNLPLILEAISEARSLSLQVEVICEYVRQRLGFQLVGELRREDGTVPLLQLSPEWEDIFSGYQIDSIRGGVDVALPPDTFNRLAERIGAEVNEAERNGCFPAIVTSSKRRRFVRGVMSSKSISNPVLAYEEIGLDARPALVGIVGA